MTGLLKRLQRAAQTSDGVDDFGRTALVTGSVAAGALLTGAVVRSIHRRRSVPPSQLPPALDAAVHDMEIMEGRYRFYAREGVGTPIVLLHSINAAASSFEMKPLFDYFCAGTLRPVYALDWFGFGLSDRPPVDYRPSTYQRQLRRFLSERIGEPTDVVALSLGAEYAAATARYHPFLFRRLVFISPTGLASRGEASSMRRSLVHLADVTGVFEIGYYRLVRPEALRTFYARNIFERPDRIPEELVRYAATTAAARGAHHAPADFIGGRLFMGDDARDCYRQSEQPALFIVPEFYESGIQSFDRLEEVLADRNQVDIWRAPGGLMPHWEHPEPLFERLATFLADES